MPWISPPSGILIRCLEIIVTWTIFLSGYLDTKVQNKNMPLMSHKNQQDHIYHYPDLEIYIFIKAVEILLIFTLCTTKHPIPKLKIKKYRILMLHNSIFEWMFLSLMHVSLNSDEMDVPLFISFFWIPYYYYIKEEILFLITVLWNQLMDFLCRYEFLRVLTYMCSVIINACVFFYIVSWAFLSMYTLVQSVLDHQNFITVILPTNMLQDSTIDVPLNEPLLATNYEQTFYAPDKYSIKDKKALFTPYKRIKRNIKVNNGTIYPPLQRQKFSRREGDDVLFTCEYQEDGFKYRSEMIDINIFWTKNGTKVKESNLLRQRKTINMYSGTISVYSELNVYVIRENDFGRYDCVHSIREHWNDPSILSSDFVMGSFFLEKINPKQYIYPVPLGNLLILNWEVFHFDQNLENDNNILYYTINDEDIESIAKKELHPYCSANVILYSYILNIERESELHVLNVEKYIPALLKNFAMHKYIAQLYICAFPGIYGVHRVKVYREIRNTETNRIELHAVNHSDEVIIIPDTPYYTEHNDSSYSQLKEDLEKHKFMTTSYISRNDKIIWWIRVIGELLLFFGILRVFIYISTTAYSYYTAIFVIPIRNFILEGYLRPHPDPLCSSKYHLCVLSSEDDTNIVVNEIVEPLQHELDINVICYNTDTCHLGGGSIFKCLSEVFKESKKILLYMTRAFIHDPECMRIQLETTVSKIVNGELMPNNVALVLRENCEVPDEFIDILQNVEIQDWTQVRLKEERISLLRRWVLSTEMVVTKVNEIVYTALI